MDNQPKTMDEWIKEKTGPDAFSSRTEVLPIGIVAADERMKELGVDSLSFVNGEGFIWKKGDETGKIEEPLNCKSKEELMERFKRVVTSLPGSQSTINEEAWLNIFLAMPRTNFVGFEITREGLEVTIEVRSPFA